jgi:hypothetical protein
MTLIEGDDSSTRLLRLLEQFLRTPATLAIEDTTGDFVTTFVPPLTGPEQTTYNHLIRLAHSRVIGITPSEFLALEADIDGLVTFQGLATPTLAQTVLAVKAQSRILKAILRS